MASQYASAWHPAASARPLHWWSAARLDVLARDLAAVLADWHVSWGLGAWAGAVACEEAATLPEGLDWIVLDADDGRPAAWLQVCAESAQRTQRALFGPDPCGPLARALAEDCAVDVRQRIAALFQARPGAGGAPAAAVQKGSGAVLARWPGVVPGVVLLGEQATRAWRSGPPSPRARLPALQPAATALSQRRIGLAVGLDGCEITLGTLRQLRPGDVLRLRHRLEAPAWLAHGTGEPLLAGHLGRRGAARAVELAAWPA